METTAINKPIEVAALAGGSTVFFPASQNFSIINSSVAPDTKLASGDKKDH